MLVASLMSFGALVVAWLVLPTSPVQAEPMHQHVAGVSPDLAA